MNDINRDLLMFIAASPTAFHTCEAAAALLQTAGYRELYESDCEETSLSPGGRYFVRRNGSSLIAFRLPPEAPASMMICASHGDSPAYKIKENPENPSALYVRLNTEKYGGMIPSTWMDRPLSVAGRLLCVDPAIPGRIFSRLVRADLTTVVIPSVAPHMAKITELNPAVDMIPLWGDGGAKDSFLKRVAEAADVAPESILSHDLFLYVPADGCVWGEGDAFISSPRLDDLQCAFASLRALTEAPEAEGVLSVCAVFDNEEVGSATKQGAASSFLSDVLHRIARYYGYTETQMRRLLSASLMVSADNAHAIHPNHGELADGQNRPEMNGGIVIKHNAAQKYTTDAVSCALFSSVCKAAGVAVQHFHNRSDMPGGSTLGNIANTHVSLNTVDIGLAQLAMHSAYETAGAHDTESLVKALRLFYGTKLSVQPDATYNILIPRS